MAEQCPPRRAPWPYPSACCHSHSPSFFPCLLKGHGRVVLALASKRRTDDARHGSACCQSRSPNFFPCLCQPSRCYCRPPTSSRKPLQAAAPGRPCPAHLASTPWTAALHLPLHSPQRVCHVHGRLQRHAVYARWAPVSPIWPPGLGYGQVSASLQQL
jgi:hypothetical protein